MAQFSQTIENKYGVKTYQETKNTYDWFWNAINAGNYPDLKIEENFLFDIGNITCSCDSITEYVENAYGQSDFSLTTLNMHIFYNKTERIYISARSDGKVWISAGSRSSLNKIVELLESTVLVSTELNDPISIAYIENQNNGIIIQGNDNIVANDDSVIEIAPSPPPQTSKWKQHLTAIIQNIVANWIWYLITIIATAWITSLALK